MANVPLEDAKDKSQVSNEPETLKERGDNSESPAKVDSVSKDGKVTKTQVTDIERKHRLRSYRPTHKATFIGLGVVLVILGINAAILGFLIKKEGANSKAISSHGVSISPGVLSKLGVSDSQIGNSNEKLTIDPAAQFNSTLTVAGDAKIGGQLHLNSDLNATNANLSQVQVGSATINSVNINGNATASTLSVRNNVAVNGAAIFQNDVTVGQLLSVDSSAAISNNLSVGGQISANSLTVGTLTIAGTITVGSHIITTGSSPSVSVGSALGSNGTAGINGNDSAGIINLGVGNGPTGYLAVHVSFRSAYSLTPVVVISPLGNYANFYLSNLTSTGFDIDVPSNLAPGGYQITYIVIQ